MAPKKVLLCFFLNMRKNREDIGLAAEELRKHVHLIDGEGFNLRVLHFDALILPCMS